MRKLPRLILDSMLMTFLLALLALPISSISLLNPRAIQEESQVLSTQDFRGVPAPTNFQIITTPTPIPFEFYLESGESTSTTTSTY